MPLSLRFVVPLALALAAIAYAVVPLVDHLTFQWFVRDLDMRSALMVQAAQEPLVELMRSGPRRAPARAALFPEHAQGQRIYALGFCDRAGKLAYATPAFPRPCAVCRASGATRAIPCSSLPTDRCTYRRSPSARITRSWAS